MSKFDIRFSADASRDLVDLDQNERSRIRAAIDQKLSTHPEVFARILEQVG